MKLKLKYPQQFKKQHKKRKNTFLTKLPTSNPHAVNKQTRRVRIVSQYPLIFPQKLIVFIRKFFRKFFKNQKIQCWFLIQPNFVITSKSKNSRMGKGVGTINRQTYRIRQLKPIFILNNISSYRAKLFCKKLNARLSWHLIIM